MGGTLRVLHVVPKAPGGGTSVFTERQIEMLAAAGVQGELVFVGGVAMARAPHRMLSSIAEIRSSLQRFQPDLVHAHWGSLLSLCTATAVLGASIPMVITFRGSDLNPVPSETSTRSAIRAVSSQLAARVATGIICVSQELKGRLWTDGPHVRVIPDGTDMTIFLPQERSVARRRLGWPADEPVALFNEGGRPQVKRSDIAEAAVAIARRSLPQLRLEKLNGQQSRADVAARINASNCLLMTSDFEGSPNIVREALACNIPVVSVPVGDVARWLDGLEGTRVVARTPEAVAEALVTLIVSGIRPDGRTRASAFSEETSRDAVIGVYEAVKTWGGIRPSKAN